MRVIVAAALAVAVLTAVSSVLRLAGLLGVQASAADAKTEKRSGLPPLTIDKGAPLLLDAPPPKAKPASSLLFGPVADNSACHCCHDNYQQESFALAHANADVGCVKCHGQSLAHRNDENNITPPDTMFPTEKIEKNCAECHDTHDAPAAKVIALWQERCAAKASPKDLLCMDCHGEHRLTIRTVVWNKKTGQLLDRQTSKPAPAATKAGAPMQ